MNASTQRKTVPLTMPEFGSDSVEKYDFRVKTTIYEARRKTVIL